MGVRERCGCAYVWEYGIVLTKRPSGWVRDLINNFGKPVDSRPVLLHFWMPLSEIPGTLFAVLTRP